jgi:putative aldouronate transport system permease protein
MPSGLVRELKKYPAIYLMLLPVVAYFMLFHYAPIYGMVIAFQDYNPGRGITGSEWVGVEQFARFFDSYYFWRLLRNTFSISFLNLLFGFPAPIVFALLLNELRFPKFKKAIQTITYMPYFISTVIICGMIIDFCRADGIINGIIEFLGGARSNLLMRPELFRTIYVSSGIWQSVGFSSIVYLAALSSVNHELYEAASIDGAGRVGQLWHVTLPSIVPTILVLLILNIGNILNVGFEKIILLYNGLTMETADVISSFVYRKGLLDQDFSYSTAVGLFNSVVGFAFLIAANNFSRRFTETSLW